ncbi:MAG: 30S ribosomal protein S4e [Candidatus Bathyarchaeota archaeon]|nr:30S ribosomal protein S4e [Candidatus Bathyarchaeum tardum]WGM89167.1 MAG: 30S ribosomal protein S4e [Candidatus Bathyarchaeum tardum]WNZ28594.1 MAG: 30S ribosomal protein S4e [Candidatus Bathyarchaeota archaeon]
MGRKGERGHLKRKPAPKLWPIHRKEAVWTVKPTPGPHPAARSLPLALIVRDMLGFAKTAKEARNIICSGKILVDGKVRTDDKFLVGLMDVISVPGINKSYRVLPSGKGLFLHAIDSEDASSKVYRVEDKTLVKNGKLQLDLHDGSSYLVNETESVTPEKVVYQTLDVLKLSIPGRELIGYNKLAVGSYVIVIGGKNMGKVGKIDSIEDQADKKRRDLLVTIKDVHGNQLQTILDFVFVLGDNQSSIALPEAK